MRLADLLRGTPYLAYSYAYPHKTAYRRLPHPLPLRELWASQRRDALFLYLHIPFCEMRCGFCNLFTTANPRADLPKAYLDTLRREARRTAAALGPARFARLAIGGGTPTYLDVAGLHALFDIAQELGADPQSIPVSVETSPKTATPERLRALRERGADRISIGVQSFIEAEAQAAGRPQRTADVVRALEAIREHGFPTLNIDLIYGIPGQTVATWLDSLRAALRYAPEELYLYPLYVRPLTGLGQRGDAVADDAAWDAQRLDCYRAGRALLLAEGYAQTSMRMFRAPHAPAQDGPVYCCQEDGMVGLGCGARSYTQALHYSSEYAVGRAGVRAILADYIERGDGAFDAAHYGIALSPEDQRRRFLIQSILQADGLDVAAYRHRFATDALDEVPELRDLEHVGLATIESGWLRLTDAGLERSDAIGPWLYTTGVQTLMEAYELR